MWRIPNEKKQTNKQKKKYEENPEPKREYEKNKY